MIAGRVPTWIAALAILASAALGLVVLDAGSPAARLAVISLGIVAGALLLRRARSVTASQPEEFDPRRVPSAATPADIATLRSIDSTLRMATASAFGVEHMLRPLVREIAAWRLGRHHGIDLATAPDAARRTIGERLWLLLHPADPYREPGAPGLPFAELEAIVDELERI